MRLPKVSDQQLLEAFEGLCREHGVLSKGFDYQGITAPCDGELYDGQKQWAMRKVPRHGWMIVGGKGGCGCPLSRWDGYIKGRWNFLMMMEAVLWSHRKKRQMPNQRDKDLVE